MADDTVEVKGGAERVRWRQREVRGETVLVGLAAEGGGVGVGIVVDGCVGCEVDAVVVPCIPKVGGGQQKMPGG